MVLGAGVGALKSTCCTSDVPFKAFHLLIKGALGAPSQVKTVLLMVPVLLAEKSTVWYL